MSKFYREYFDENRKRKITVLVEEAGLEELIKTVFTSLNEVYNDNTVPQKIKKNIITFAELLNNQNSPDIVLKIILENMGKLWDDLLEVENLSENAKEKFLVGYAYAQAHYPLPEFEDLYKNFKHGAFRNSNFLNMVFDDVAQQNVVGDNKIQMLVNTIIQNYRAILRSWNGESEIEDATTIQRFFLSYFNIHLPVTLEKGEHLSLFSMVLNDKRANDKDKRIPHKFAAMIGKPMLSDSFTDPCTPEELLLELNVYIAHHEFKPLNTLNTLNSEYIENTIEVAEMLSRAIQRKRNVEVRKKHQQKLRLSKIIELMTHEDEFGKIINKYYIAGILPANIQNALDKKYETHSDNIINQYQIKNNKEVIIGNKEIIEIENEQDENIPSFTSLILKFERMANSVNTRGKWRIDSIRIGISDIDRNLTENQKTEQFIHIFLQEYRTIIRSTGGGNSRLAEAMREFSKNHLGIGNLPKELEKGEMLNLYSLIKDARDSSLSNNKIKKVALVPFSPRVGASLYSLIANEQILRKNNSHVFFSPKFSAITGKNYFGKIDKKDKFILDLKSYKTQRLHQGDTKLVYYFNEFLNFFAKQFNYSNTFNNFRSEAKCNTTEKLLDVVEHKKKHNFTDDDVMILKDGKLGDLANKFKDELPEDLRMRISGG